MNMAPSGAGFYPKMRFQMTDSWLPTLITKTPEEGFQLAIKLSRMAVKKTQPDVEVLHRLRTEYAEDAAGLTAASHMVAVNFQTVAAANDYWRA